MKKILFSAIILVLSTSALLSQSFLPVYQRGHGEFVADLEIGNDIESEVSSFNLPVDICVDDAGNIIVADFRDFVVKIFDSDGKYVKTVSRQGSGPGEHSSLMGMTLNSDDRIVTNDFGNRRFNIFESNGEFVKSIPIKDVIPSIYQFVREIRSTTNGWLILSTRKFNIQNQDEGSLYSILITGNSFEHKTVLDSFRVFDVKYISEPSYMPIPMPYAPKLIVCAIHSGGLVIGKSDESELSLYNKDLNLEKKFKHGIKLQKITRKDKNRYWARLDSAYEASNRPHETLDLLKKNTEIPDYFPYYDDIYVDHEGFILLKPLFDVEKDHYYVYTESGEFVNRVKIDNMPMRPVFRHGYVYGLNYTEEGIFTVVRRKFE